MAMSTRSVRAIYPARLLLIDYGLSEKIVQGICQGLDQLFSITKNYVGIPRIPMFGLLINGQHQSEIFLPLSSIRQNHMELQVALCKLQLLAQKWATKSHQCHAASSWNSALQLVQQEMKSMTTKNADHRYNPSTANRDVRIVIITNRVSDSSIAEIQQFTQTHLFDVQNIELVYIDEHDQIDSFKKKLVAIDWLKIKFIRENKYSIGLYFKSWLTHNDHDNEYIQLYLPCVEKTRNLIRCDLHDILIDPRHHAQHERFLIYTEPRRTSNLPKTPSSWTLPIYQLKAISLIKQTHCCISLIFGMPLLMTSTICQKYGIESIEQNDIAFDSLVDYLRQHGLMLICRLDDETSTNGSELLSGHFILSPATEHCLIIRSIASSELLLPLPTAFNRIIKQEHTLIDQSIVASLAQMKVEEEEYNPLLHEARKSQITLNTNLI